MTATTMTNGRGPAVPSSIWRDDPDVVRPTVLVLGGFLTAPPMYRSFAGRLVARGAAGVVVSSVWTPDWLLAAARGPAAIATRAGRALLEASRLSIDGSRGAPLLVVGHSAGGLVARLLTAPEPFPGRRFNAAARIGAIVTLGTPHRVSSAGGIGRRLSTAAAQLAETYVPGAAFAPRVGYVSVASRYVAADPAGSGRQRVAYRLYRSILGRSVVAGTEGDGLVPVPSALLPGARLVLVQSGHGPGAGVSWYGTDEVMDAWWPVALEAWHEALRWRVAAAASDSPDEAPAADAPGVGKGGAGNRPADGSTDEPVDGREESVPESAEAAG